MDWRDVIETSSGDISRLNYVWRFSTIPVSTPESVAEHSYWVTLYSLMIHKELGGDKSLIAPILIKALVHDLPEIWVGDIVRTAKYKTEEFKRAVDMVEQIFIEESPDQIKGLFSLLKSLIPDDNSDYVHAIVKAADFMSLFQFMRREWLRGNREIKPFYEIMINDLNQAGERMEKENLPWAKDLADLYFQLTQSAAEVANFRAAFLRRKRNGDQS